MPSVMPELKSAVRIMSTTNYVYRGRDIMRKQQHFAWMTFKC